MSHNLPSTKSCRVPETTKAKDAKNIPVVIFCNGVLRSLHFNGI